MVVDVKIKPDMNGLSISAELTKSDPTKKEV